MPIVLFIHHLKEFDPWFELFSANPPPSVGKWRCMRGVEDPTRVHVIGEMEPDQVIDVKNFFASERMINVFDEVNALSTKPIETVWLQDVIPE